MKTRNFALSALLSVSALLPVAVYAADTPTRGPMAFSDYDANGDGVITQEEFNTAHANRMQTNSAAGMPMRGAANMPMFEQFDTNKDGKLTQEELKQGQMMQQQQMMENRQEQMQQMHQQMQMQQMHQQNQMQNQMQNQGQQQQQQQNQNQK